MVQILMPTDSLPLVSILIATKDRPDDLQRTLKELRRQDYASLEMIVIDDGSSAVLEPIVREYWPQTNFVRRSESVGQCRRRSEGFQIARGEYILQLDDDSHPVASSAISEAVRVMQANPSFGGLSFYIFNGPDLPEKLQAAEPQYHASFVGCGVLFRTQALRQVGGYRDFFENEWEEEELGLRMLAAGWVIYFFPATVIHHHVSVRNRKQVRTWTRQIRNKLWAIVMNTPAGRIPLEAAWVVLVGFLDAIRLLRFKAYYLALVQFIGGFRRALRLRKPMPAIALSRYDAIRFKGIFTAQDYQSPVKLGWREIWRWFTKSWMNRARQRSVWDRRPGDIGGSPTVGFAHQYSTKSTDRDP
jgi:GT2 family glycosyltransferase